MNRKNHSQVALRRGMARAFVLGPVVFLLVAGAGCPSLFESTTQRAAHSQQAVVGKDGVYVVPGPNTVVNVYAQLAGTADPAAGDKTITVADVNTDFLSAVVPGDLLLIVQMAGATINVTDTANYGTVTDLGSAGRYEFVGVEAKSGSLITLACGLKNGYSRAGKTQVIRVPQYTTLTVGAGNSITARAWNGVTGGVVAVHAETTLQLGGTIDVSAKGFQGGAADNLTGLTGTATTLYRSAVNTDGAEKGEGIAGYQDDYTNGRYGRGAPANAGGGGDSHNAGGGGGANAPSGAAWTGQGVMEQCAVAQAWRSAWQLDDGYISNPATANTCSNSEGGGRGGYSYSSVAQNPLTDGPGAADVGTCAGATGWGGNCRRQVGGLGGRPVLNDPSSRLFMGGGGGAGDGNNNAAGRGGNGGGLVFIIAGTVAGAGSILANGEAGANAVFVAGGGDAPGGGGGGGTVVVHATTLSAITISVNGGHGGNQVGSSGDNEVEGPGGGGGGGYIAVSGGTATVTATGGPAGTTDRAVMTTFAVDGATAGNAGLTTGSATTFLYCGSLPVTTIAGPTNPSKNAVGVFTFTNTSSPVTYECKLDSGVWAACTASYTTGTLADGSHTLSVRATDSNANVEAPPATFTWVIDTVAPNTVILTKPTDPSTSATGAFTFTTEVAETPAATYECKLDSGDWAACGVPVGCGVDGGATCTITYTTPALANGAHTLSVRATDAAGNVDATPAVYTWGISTTSPVTTIATKPKNPSKNPTGDFTFTNTVSTVTYECKLDTGAWTTCGASYTTPTLVDGPHTLSVRSSESITDAGAIVEDPPVTYTWTIDTVAPDTTIATEPLDPSSSATGVFTFTSNEDPVTYACKLDTGDWASCTASYTTPELANGSHTLAVRATDTAGNVDASPATYTWTVEGSSVDGGAPDGGFVVALDGALVSTVDAERLDTQGVDFASPRDLAPALDVGKIDNAPADLLPDVQQAGPDTAPPAPEPNPDTAAPVVKEDAAQPIANKDAAPAGQDVKIMGAGFCAIASPQSTTPAPFLVLGLAALALVRRRRKS